LAQLVLQDAAAESDVGRRLEHLYHAGQLLMEPDGDLHDAIRVLEEARQLSPESVEGIVLLSRAYSAAGRADSALEMLREVVDAHRGRRFKALVDVYREMARIHLAEGFLTDALEALTKAFEMDLRNWRIAMELGALAVDSEEDNTATRAYRTVTMMKAGDDGELVPPEARAEAYCQLALLAHKQGDPRKAKVLVTKALSENPEHETARALSAELEGQ
jgi:lipopolysaccharide biosynthesis regulator YciM